MRPEYYKKRDFCKVTKCPIQKLIEKGEMEKSECMKENCIKTAYRFEKWLEDNGYFIIKNARIKDNSIFKMEDIIIDIKMAIWNSDKRQCENCFKWIHKEEEHLEILITRKRSMRRIYIHKKCLNLTSKARIYLRVKDFLKQIK